MSECRIALHSLHCGAISVQRATDNRKKEHTCCVAYGKANLGLFSYLGHFFVPKQMIYCKSSCIFPLGCFVSQCTNVMWAKAHTLTGLFLTPLQHCLTRAGRALHCGTRLCQLQQINESRVNFWCDEVKCLFDIGADKQIFQMLGTTHKKVRNKWKRGAEPSVQRCLHKDSSWSGLVCFIPR